MMDSPSLILAGLQARIDDYARNGLPIQAHIARDFAWILSQQIPLIRRAEHRLDEIAREMVDADKPGPVTTYERAGPCMIVHPAQFRKAQS